MATVLSRALKLPGKKSPDLGEYDPLTQADSDESEDDLVLNLQQKNGGIKNGKTALGEVPEPDSDSEAASTAKTHLSEVATEGFPSEPLGALEQKTTSSLVSYVRTSVFLLTVVFSMILVLVCAFLIPCPPRDMHSSWSRHLGSQGVGDLSPLELADVNGDGLRDVLLSFVSPGNVTAAAHSAAAKPTAVLMCLSGLNGSSLWTTTLPEEAHDVKCSDLVPGRGVETTCLVTGSHKMLSMVNATSGKAAWTLNRKHLSNGTLAAPGVLLPDLDEDGFRDVVVLATRDQQPDLCFLLVSGRTGRLLGRPVKYNIVGVGNLIGPQVYTTTNGAVYILFGFGNIQAVALRDIFVQARSRENLPPSLQIEEPEWEKKKFNNLTKLIDIYGDGVELLQMVKATNSNSSNLLVTTRQSLVLLRGQNLTPAWTVNFQGLLSPPVTGYYTDDETLDFFLQIQDGPRDKKVVVVDGESGSDIWSYSISSHLREMPAASAFTSDRKSVFLFWAEELTDWTPPHGHGPGQPHRLYHLYLLHPAFPTTLLDLANATGSVKASAVGINDLWKDAFYVTRALEPSSEGHTAPLVVSKLSLRWAMMEGQMIQLMETITKTGHGELRRFISRMKFVDPPQI